MWITEKFKQIDNALLVMEAMTDDRISILQEEFNGGLPDEHTEKDYQTQIDHFKVCKKQAEEAKEALRIIEMYLPIEDIKKVVEYLYNDECRNAKEYQNENGNYNRHIFENIENVNNWIDFIEVKQVNI